MNFGEWWGFSATDDRTSWLILPKIKKREYLSGEEHRCGADWELWAWDWEFSFWVKASERVLVCSVFSSSQKRTFFFNQDRSVYIPVGVVRARKFWISIAQWFSHCNFLITAQIMSLDCWVITQRYLPLSITAHIEIGAFNVWNMWIIWRRNWIRKSRESCC